MIRLPAGKVEFGMSAADGGQYFLTVNGLRSDQPLSTASVRRTENTEYQAAYDVVGRLPDPP
jgi:hypothetical protein